MQTDLEISTEEYNKLKEVVAKVDMLGGPRMAKELSEDDRKILTQRLEVTLSVCYKERYLKACTQRSSCRWSIMQSFGAQLGCDCDKESMA